MNTPVSESDSWVGVADCRSCSVRESAVFSGLEEADFGLIHQGITQIKLERGEYLYRANDHGSEVFTVRNGLLKLNHTLANGDQRIVSLVRTSELTGMEALIGQPYRQDAIALQATEICKIPVKMLNTLVESNTNMHRKLMERYESALSRAERWISDFSTGSAKQRISRLMLCMTENSDENQCYLTNREEISNILGLTVETTSRTMAEFKRQGLIEEHQRKSIRCDTAALEKIANAD